jgi:CTP:molybdopterin cytidylyltransferase MocA
VLAAGAGRRFGGPVPKPLAPFRGRPLVTWPVSALRDGGAAPVLVVAGAHAAAVAAAVEPGGAEVVACPDWREGLAASLRCGVAAAAGRGAEAVVVALGDQPLLAAAAVARVVAARRPGAHDALRATYDGAPAHPVLLEAAAFAAVGALHGDAGARALLRPGGPLRVGLVACDGLGRPDDADTWDALRALE